MKNINYLVGFTILAFAFIVSSLPSLSSAQVLTRQLQQGMSGSDVSALQTFLAKDQTIYPQGLVTGYFGTLTTSAVSNFQAKNGIATVGRVGPVTLAAINLQMNGDMVSPTFYNINVSANSNSATFSWNTNENSTAVIYYGTSFQNMTESSATTGVSIGGSSSLVNSNFQTSHTATITSLSANTTYYYVLYVKDAAGNESVTWPSTFSTSN
jgi:peptidoglycan hydrolase-like protein with peptidoglycan-binding domain